MSLNSHYKRGLSRRDDLESIGYILLYFSKRGELDWMNLHIKDKDQQNKKIRQLKSRQMEVICKGAPSPLLAFMNAVRQLGFASDPNYKMLRNLFVSWMNHNAIPFDGHFDWPKNRSEMTDLSLQSLTKSKSTSNTWILCKQVFKILINFIKPLNWLIAINFSEVMMRKEAISASYGRDDPFHSGRFLLFCSFATDTTCPVMAMFRSLFVICTDPNLLQIIRID